MKRWGGLKATSFQAKSVSLFLKQEGTVQADGWGASLLSRLPGRSAIEMSCSFWVGSWYVLNIFFCVFSGFLFCFPFSLRAAVFKLFLLFCCRNPFFLHVRSANLWERIAELMWNVGWGQGLVWRPGSPSGGSWDLAPLGEGSLGQGGKPWFSGWRLLSSTPHEQGDSTCFLGVNHFFCKEQPCSLDTPSCC